MSLFFLKDARAKLVEKQNLLQRAKQELKKAEALVCQAEQAVKSASKEYKLHFQRNKLNGNLGNSFKNSSAH